MRFSMDGSQKSRIDIMANQNIVNTVVGQPVETTMANQTIDTTMEANPPLAKKQKTSGEPLPQVISVSSFENDCGSSCVSSASLILTASVVGEGTGTSSVSDEKKLISDEGSTTAEQEAEVSLDVATYLRAIASSASLQEALDAMNTLYKEVGATSDSKQASALAQKVTSDPWFSSIVGCLARYHQSEEFSVLVITFLATLLFYEPQTTAKVLMDLRAIDTVLNTARMHPQSELMSMNSVGLISNLSCESGDVRASVAHAKHVAFVSDSMNRRPTNESIQSAGCIYFKHVAQEATETRKSLLEDNDAIVSLGIAMKTFRSSQNVAMYECAKQVVKFVVN